MKTMTTQHILRIAPLAAVIWATTASANVGTVAFVLGSAHKQQTPTQPLVKKDPVDNGDTVVTGNDGRVQLRMIDGGKIAIRPDSTFSIENYAVTAAATETSAVAASNAQKNTAVLNLLKGGFRTITGDAANRDPQNYRVKTPVATMGIRGTHYQVRLCEASCASELPAGAADSYRGPGLYVGVYEGSVWVESEGGQIEISAGEFVFVATLEAAPRLLAKPSRVLRDDPPPPGRRGNRRTDTTRLQPDSTNLRRRPTAQEAPDSPNESPGNGDVPDPDRQRTAEGGRIDISNGGGNDALLERSISWSYGPDDVSGDATTSIESVNTTLQSGIDNNGSLVRFEGGLDGAAGPQNARFELGTATVTNTGQDIDTGLRWGRWSDGIANVTVGGNTREQNLQDQSLHWITSPLTNQAAPALPQTGTADYQLIGNTNPTDNVGTVGLLGSATLQANFTDQNVTSTLNLGIAGENWQATGSAPLNAPQFAGDYSSVTVNGVATGNGQFSGFLLPVDPNINETLPAGAGVSYSLNDPNNNRSNGGITVSGTAAFGDPQ